MTEPFVPTGIKTGLCTGPWGVANVPVRAAPSVACKVKSNMLGNYLYESVCSTEHAL